MARADLDAADVDGDGLAASGQVRLALDARHSGLSVRALALPTAWLEHVTRSAARRMSNSVIQTSNAIRKTNPAR